MNASTRVARFALAALAVVPMTTAKGAVTLMEQGKWKFDVGGFVELDSFADSTGSLTEVVGNNPIAHPGTSASAAGRTQFSPRNSRMSFGLQAPAAEDWKTQGYLEFDLLGYNPAPGSGNSEASFYTNPTLRLRHAYLQGDSGGWMIRAGQSWSLFGWQPSYFLSTVTLQPVAAVMYERALQVTTIKTFDLDENNKIQAGLSVVRPIQRDSQTPGVDVGVRLAMGGRRGAFSAPNGGISAEPMSLGLSATARDLSVPTAAPGQSVHYLGSGIAADLLVPIIASETKHDIQNTLVLTAEATAGQGYGDEFPGWSGNLPAFTHQNATTPNIDAGQMGQLASGGGFQIVKLTTWNTGLQYHLPKSWSTWLNVGYSQLRSTNVRNMVAAAGQTPYDRSEAAFVNVFHDFSQQVRAAAEYSYLQTHYADASWAHNNRIQMSGWFRF